MSRGYDPVLTRDIKRTTAYKKIDKSIINETGDDLYPHLTFSIDNVAQFLEIISIATSINKRILYKPDIIYRGMSDSRYELIPSLARCKCHDYNFGYLEVEHYMVNEFLSLRPEAFKELSSNFELLSKMQHYGLPTRLLDFTTNPLMSLFFACNGNSKKDGRVICHQGELDYTTDDIIEEAICGTYRYNIDTHSKLDIILSHDNVSLYHYLRRLYCVNGSLLSRPKYWTERQQRQSSVFMIFPNKLHDDLGLWASWDNEDIEKFSFINELLSKLNQIRNHECPSKIYQMRESFVLKNDFEQETKHKKVTYDVTVTKDIIRKIFKCYDKSEIVNRTDDFTEKGKLSFSQRFSFDPELQRIDTDALKKQFCSIIIKKNKKQHILNELAVLGIDKAFVYPELEYTAEKIRSKFMSNTPTPRIEIYL